MPDALDGALMRKDGAGASVPAGSVREAYEFEDAPARNTRSRGPITRSMGKSNSDDDLSRLRDEALRTAWQTGNVETGLWRSADWRGCYSPPAYWRRY